MKNTIIKYGLISGAIAAGLQFIMTLSFKWYGFDKVGFDNAAYYGYTLITLSMAVIFLGIKAYRDTEGGGKVTFAKGFMMGLGIALISCICYSLMWMVVYYNILPNFMEEYSKYSLRKLQESGASDADIVNLQRELNSISEIYKTPLGVFAITMIEPLPVGILIALVSSLILRRQ